MQIGEIITDVRRELVETVASFWSDDELLDLANRAERDYVNRTRMLEAKSFLSTTDGIADYPLPSNWLSARAVFYNDPDDSGNSSWHRLMPTNLEKQGQENQSFLSTESTVRDTPRRYMIWDKNIYLDPVPDTTGSSNVAMFFKSKPVAYASTSEELHIDETLSEALNAYMLWKAWSKEKEAELASEQRDLYFTYVGEGRRWVKKQSGDQRYRIDIDSIDPIQYGSDTRFNPFF